MAKGFRGSLFGAPRSGAEYAFVVTRIVLAYLWLDTVIPRWMAFAAGHMEANGILKNMFGASLGVPMTLFVTALETLAAISMLLGLLVRLGALWGVVEFAITGAYAWTAAPSQGHLTGNFTLLRDFGLFAGSLTLLLWGSFKLSLDGVLAKRK